MPEDCTYYICSLAVLAAFTYNQLIEAWEVRDSTNQICFFLRQAAILFTLYIGASLSDLTDLPAMQSGKCSPEANAAEAT